MVGDDFTSEDNANTTCETKSFVMDLCRSLDVAENCCSATDVKVSIIEAQSECLVFLINSAASKKAGTVALPKAYRSAEIVFGSGSATANGTELHFTLGADESAVLYLQ